MQAEIEAKFLDIDHDELRARLRKASAVCDQPMRDMRRKIYDFADKRLQDANAFVRLRDEGDKITLSFKKVSDRTVQGTKEVCLNVDSFDQADAFLRAIGMVAKAYHETRRESWHLGTAQIELDEWPWVPSIAEIEAPDETTLWKTAEQLGLDRKNSVHGTAEILYTRLYDVTEAEVNAWPKLEFGPVPDWLAAKRR